MKKKNALRHLLAAALACAMAFPLAALPAQKAEAEDMTLGSGFTDPTITVSTMYYWKEGVPPVVRNRDGKTEGSTIGTEFPIIIMLNDSQYLDIPNPAATIDNKNSCRYNAYDRTYRENANWNDYNLPAYTKYYDRGLPGGYRARWRTYSDSCIFLFDTLEIAQSLRQNGVAASMDVPTHLYAVPAEGSGDIGRYGLELGKGTDEWLVGELYFKCQDQIGRGYFNNLDWALEARDVDRKSFVSADYMMSPRNAVANQVPNYNSEAAYTKIDVDHRTWSFGKADNGKYTISTDGTASWYVEKWTSSEVTGWKDTARDFANGGIWNWSEMWLCHNIDYVHLYGDDESKEMVDEGVIGSWIRLPDNYDKYGVQTRGLHKDDMSHATAGEDDNYQFRVFYGEPNIVSFIQTDTKVQNGQVVNLDGPIVIGEHATVTVEEGGVLVVSGWVMNGGYIMVKPGGMVIVQDQERLDGTKQYGVISCYQETPNRKNGRISCDGIMIVNRDCKVIGAGAYGIQFGEGAQCVNYGQLISENFEVYGDHTIENRGDVSAVYAGWGLTGGSFAMANQRIEMGPTFNGQSTIEKASAVKLARDAVYGPGASRLYLNSATKVFKQTNMANRKGRVTDVEPVLSTYTAKVDSRDGVYYLTDAEGYRYDWYDSIENFARFEYEDGAFKRYDFGGYRMMPGGDPPERAEGVADYDPSRNNFFIRDGGATYWYNAEKKGFLDESKLTDVYYTGPARFPDGVTGAEIERGGEVPEREKTEGTYMLESALKEGALLDVQYASKDSGGNVILNHDTHGDNQKWIMRPAGSERKNGRKIDYYKFISVNSGMALSVENANYSSGANVVQATPRDDGDDQKWRLIPEGDGYYRIVTKSNESLALDVYGAIPDDGTNVQIYTVNGSAAQRWRLLRAG